MMTFESSISYITHVVLKNKVIFIHCEVGIAVAIHISQCNVQVEYEIQTHVVNPASQEFNHWLAPHTSQFEST